MNTIKKCFSFFNFYAIDKLCRIYSFGQCMIAVSCRRIRGIRGDVIGAIEKKRGCLCSPGFALNVHFLRLRDYNSINFIHIELIR